MPTTLTPLPQHRILADWLFREEQEVWTWFNEKEKAVNDDEQVRLSLLRDNYRMDAEGHPEVLQEIEAACAALEIEATVHAYQAEHHTQPNAAVCHLEGEAHVIFLGSHHFPAERGGTAGGDWS